MMARVLHRKALGDTDEAPFSRRASQGFGCFRMTADVRPKSSLLGCSVFSKLLGMSTLAFQP